MHVDVHIETLVALQSARVKLFHLIGLTIYTSDMWQEEKKYRATKISHWPSEMSSGLTCNLLFITGRL